ncbi:MAG: ATP-dependent DNA helicase RecG [Gemmatimonadota bacterium]|nr:ATP-dependent DNA helicase RecG [Gemmatimonadota bacterium]
MFPELDAPVSTLRGVGAKREELLCDVGISTVADLLLFLPYRYVDRTRQAPIAALPEGEEVTAVAPVRGANVATGRRPRFVLVLEDESGTLECVWFSGHRYLRRAFSTGDLLAVGGRLTRYGGKRQMVHPDVEVISDSEEGTRVHTGRVIPVYSTTARMKAERLTSRGLRRIIHQALEDVRLPEPLPDPIGARSGALSLGEAVRMLHFPVQRGDVEAARRRLAFDELLYFQLRLRSLQDVRNNKPAPVMPPRGLLTGKMLATLSFEPTGAQRRALTEIGEDLTRARPMRRLLQGDVGSGKTLVATAAMLSAVDGGAQAAMMAPTEILAEQHARTIGALAAPLGLVVARLTGRQPQRERSEILQGLAWGRVHLVVGTHALLQESVVFSRLGLAVVDEQHRFGVLQRAALLEKEGGAHLLVMTATPIPRSLALTLYGDLEVTVLDELPPGRQPVKTGWRAAADREKAYRFLREQVSAGGRAYIVFPAIEDAGAGDVRAAAAAFEELRDGALSGLRLGLLHGRLAPAEKDAVMAAFRNGSLDVLVSTTVIEVGVDVPGATVMMVENAERFGLAQLHQLRGRVGRGAAGSYCILIADPADGLSPDARERLDAMAATGDGFEIAEMDLRIRGPGQIFGTRQAGYPEFRFADLARDLDLVRSSRKEAAELLDRDPNLDRHDALRKRVESVNLEGKTTRAG